MDPNLDLTSTADENNSPVATDAALKQWKRHLVKPQCQFAAGLFLLLAPPVLFADRSFGRTGWLISLAFCFVGFLAHRMLPPFLTRRGLPIQILPQIQAGFQGIPFLFLLMALVNPTILHIELKLPASLMLGAIAATMFAGAVIMFTAWLKLSKLRLAAPT